MDLRKSQSNWSTSSHKTLPLNKSIIVLEHDEQQKECKKTYQNENQIYKFRNQKLIFKILDRKDKIDNQPQPQAK